ncbi:MAG: hypothetical protein BMS9Abin13_242 [Patescibacteria group bacterium]|nr:MAG: hypothetical protein BMS9Abin13_242 [Patescibacteria group bacterium]
MLFLIVIAFVVGLLIYYVLSLDFEAGTGFTEAKKKAREVEYTVVSKDRKDTERKLLK